MVHKYKGKKNLLIVVWCWKVPKHAKSPEIVILTLISEEALSTAELWQTQDHYHQTRLELSPAVELLGREGEGRGILPFSSYTPRSRCRIKVFWVKFTLVQVNFFYSYFFLFPLISCSWDEGEPQSWPRGCRWCTNLLEISSSGLRDTPGTRGLSCWVSCSAGSLQQQMGPSLLSSCSDPGALKLLELRGERNGSDKAAQGLWFNVFPLQVTKFIWKSQCTPGCLPNYCYLNC